MSFNSFNLLSTPTVIICSILAICLIIQVFFYLYFYIRLGLRSKKRGNNIYNNDFPPISIIICAGNQLSELQKNLPILLNLDYNTYEVIVVDMNSNDGSAEYLEYMASQHENLYCSHTTKDSRIISRKKLAQTIGIKASKYDLLVFTEPNCTPTSNKWLKEYTEEITDHNEIILGYTKYEMVKSKFHRMVAYDHILMAMRYLGFAKAGVPYTGIGSNMAYQKDLFFAQKGYVNQLNLQRGEDEIFINSSATAQNTSVVSTPESVVKQSPIETMEEWKSDKIYHFTSLSRFQGYQQYANSLDTGSRLFLYIGGFITLLGAIATYQWILSLVVFIALVLHWVLQFCTTNFVLKRLGDEHRFYFSILYYNIALPVYTFLFKLKTPRKRRGDILRY